VGQIAVIVKDPDRATAFYRDVLGMTFLFRAPPGLAFFDCGGVRIMLTPPEGADERHSSILYYAVDDIQEAAGTLRTRGVAFEEEPHLIARLPDREVWIGTFRDSEGNVLALISEPRC
jgi:methylmalonyl-CoA/ethylmalonyl-CoA epimerase